MRLRAVVLAVALFAAVRSASAEPEDPQCHGALDGHAVDAATHQPVVAATVRIANDLLATTDAAGRVLLAVLCPGDVTIIVEREDYKPAEAKVTISSTARASVEVQMTTSGEV